MGRRLMNPDELITPLESLSAPCDFGRATLQRWVFAGKRNMISYSSALKIKVPDWPHNVELLEVGDRIVYLIHFIPSGFTN